MEISVVGTRISTTNWEKVRNLPKDKLPRLSDEQKKVANRLKVSEEDYARSALAGQETQARLLVKTEQFAKLLEQKVKEQDPNADVDRVALLTWDHKFDVQIRVGGRSLPVLIDETIVDDLFEGGLS